MAESGPDARTAEREIVLSRRFDAPRDLVWRALTEPEHVIHWWGPYGFTNTIHEMDVSPGGVWRFIMHGPDGTDYHNFVRYLEVVPPERLVFDHGTSEDDIMFRNTITLDEAVGGTLVTLRAVFPTQTDRDEAIQKRGAIEGGNQTLARLGEYLKTMEAP